MMKLSNNAILFIAAGLYLALGELAGYLTVNAGLLLYIGIDRFRWDRSRLALIVIILSTIALIISQFALFAVLVLASLCFYYFRARPQAEGAGVSYIRSKHRLLLNLRLDEQSWILQSMSCWHGVGEIRMDLSRAVPESKMTVIVLQGLVGDVDLTIPEDYGLQIEASALVGNIGHDADKKSGFVQRHLWRSPDFEERENRLKLQLFYLVGDIKIRTV